MSEPKWTPGPWRAKGADVQLDRFNVSIAHCAEVGLPAEANAHLIAAAPDLYDELENARVIIWGEAPQYGAALARIHSALAKARGER